MKLKFEPLYRSLILTLAALLVWSVWAQAQTNLPPAEPAPHAPGLLNLEADRTWFSFGLDRVPVLVEHRVLDVPLWQYLASFLFVVLAFQAARLLDWLMRVQLRKWTARTETQLDDLLVELLRGPVKVVAFVILLHIGLEVYVWPAWVTGFLSKGLKLVAAVSVTYMALKLIDLLTGYWKRHATAEEDRAFNEQLLPIVRNALKTFAVIVALLLTLQNLGLNITSLIASLSIGGLALSLAAQDTLANLFGAIAVFIDKPFRIGDRIKLDAIDGVVELIGLRSTRVRNADGHLITVPNKTMGNATITNIARRPNIRTEFNLGLPYDTSAAKIQQALTLLEQICRAQPLTHDLWISFNKFTDSTLNILVVHWWNGTDQKAYLAGMQELNLTIKARFDEAGIEFAFPTQMLHVRTGGSLEKQQP